MEVGECHEVTSVAAQRFCVLLKNVSTGTEEISRIYLLPAANFATV